MINDDEYESDDTDEDREERFEYEKNFKKSTKIKKQQQYQHNQNSQGKFLARDRNRRHSEFRSNLDKFPMLKFECKAGK